jgi:hypothetical protein
VKTIIFFSSFLILLTGTCFGFEFEKFRWYDFSGKVGGAPVSLAIYVSENGKLDGNYCYVRFDNKIILRGKVQEGKILLQEFVNDKLNGSFNGQIVSDSSDRLEGTWSDNSGSRKMPFSLVLKAINSGTATKRYTDFPGSDENLEGFMKKVKNAIVKGDKTWLSERIKYPLVTYLDGKTSVTIKNKNQFLQDFDRIIHPGYRERVKGLCTCNLFANYRGAMAGNGEIWINLKPGSTPQKFSFVITALNN